MPVGYQGTTKKKKSQVGMGDLKAYEYQQSQPTWFEKIFGKWTPAKNSGALQYKSAGQPYTNYLAEAFNPEKLNQPYSGWKKGPKIKYKGVHKATGIPHQLPANIEAMLEAKYAPQPGMGDLQLHQFNQGTGKKLTKYINKEFPYPMPQGYAPLPGVGYESGYGYGGSGGYGGYGRGGYGGGGGGSYPQYMQYGGRPMAYPTPSRLPTLPNIPRWMTTMANWSF